MDKLCGTKYFSKLNVRWGYNNVHITQGDEWKAAFRTNQGLYKPMVTCSISIYACNFAVSTNKYMLQGPDTKALRNTTERNDYNASNEITRVKWGGAHDLT